MGLGLKGGLSDSAFAGVAARQGMRRVAAGAARLLSPFGQRVPPKLLIAPQDIRTSDPTIAAEIYAGQLKLAGKLLETHGRSPFEMEPPSEAFAVELHDLILESGIDACVYGHHHRNIPAFSIGKTRMLTNQLGYVRYGEHAGFDPGAVL